jgi:hypothetical protein
MKNLTNLSSGRRRERENRAKAIVEHFPEIMKDTKQQTQEVQQISSRIIF